MKRLIACAASIGAVALVLGLLVFWFGGSSPAEKFMKKYPYSLSSDKAIGQEQQEIYGKDRACYYIAYPKTENKSTNTAIKNYIEEIKAQFEDHCKALKEQDSNLFSRLVIDYQTDIWEKCTQISFFYTISDQTPQGTAAQTEETGGKTKFHLDESHKILDLNGVLGEDSEEKINLMLKSSGKTTEDMNFFGLDDDTLTLYWDTLGSSTEALSVNAIRRAGMIDPTKPMVAITFDDGPGRYSRDFADLLTRYGARATFFVLGSNVKNFADDLKYVYDQGNEIASHTMNHKNLDKLSESGIRQEIDDAKEAIVDAIGVEPTLIRTPYGNANSKVMGVIDGPMIKWSVDTLDWQTRNAEAVKKEILEGVADGEIILMHEIYKTSLEGLEMALEELSKEDYQFVTVSELIQYRGVTPEAKHYYSFKKK